MKNIQPMNFRVHLQLGKFQPLPRRYTEVSRTESCNLRIINRKLQNETVTDRMIVTKHRTNPTEKCFTWPKECHQRFSLNALQPREGNFTLTWWHFSGCFAKYNTNAMICFFVCSHDPDERGYSIGLSQFCHWVFLVSILFGNFLV